MKITVEAEYGTTQVSATAVVPAVQVTGDEAEWLVGVFKKLVEDGILGSRS